MNLSPQVTIIMATFNRAHFIYESLKSIQAQTVNAWECIIIDDGGTDNTKEIIAPLLSQDSRFNFLKRPSRYKKGLSGCRNYGLDLVKGNHIVFFDDDDIIHPQNLEIGLAIFKINPTIGYLHYVKQSFIDIKEVADLPKIDSYTAHVATPSTYEDLITGTMGFASCTVLWKASSFKKIRFNDMLQYAEEWECYTRILINFPRGIITDAVLYYNRKHLASNTGEFFNGNPIRKKAKVAASKLVITYLNDLGLLSAKLQKYFTWESVLLKEVSINKHLMSQSSIGVKSKWKAWFYYSFSPLIKIYLKNKNNH